MFCIVVMENFGCPDFVSNPGAEYSIYGSSWYQHSQKVLVSVSPGARVVGNKYE